MALPQFQSDNKALNLMQNKWATALNPIIDAPLNKGYVLQSVHLASGANTINHLLGRKLQGWFLTRVRANATVYDTQDSNPRPELTLTLTASGAVVCDIYVF